MKEKCLLIALFSLYCCRMVEIRAQEVVGPPPDSLMAVRDSMPKKSFFKKLVDYFGDANKNKSNKAFDFSIIGGPHYSSDTKLGLGLVAAGLYRMDRNDTIMSPSNVSLYGDVATSGFYLLGVRGNNLFPKDRFRLVYNLYFFSFPGNFWGTGYENGRNDDNKSSFKRLQNQIKVDFLVRLGKNLYLGPNISFDYVAGKDFTKPELLEGEPESTTSVGAGAALVYDSRDFLTNAYHGFYLKAEQRFYPGFLGNKFGFSRTDVVADYYHPVWKGGVIATDFHTQLNYGDVPWTMLAPLGGSYRMRGYYEGRYRDRNLVELQVELRQNVWRRSGVALWVGAGNVFSNFGKFDWSHTLPNYGVGYRWEFKKRVNVRLDLGFGKGEKGFMFNINEAF